MSRYSLQFRDHAKTYMKFKKRNRLQRGAGGSDAQIILFTFLNFIYKTVTFNFQMTQSFAVVMPGKVAISLSCGFLSMSTPLPQGWFPQHTQTTFPRPPLSLRSGFPTPSHLVVASFPQPPLSLRSGFPSPSKQPLLIVVASQLCPMCHFACVGYKMTCSGSNTYYQQLSVKLYRHGQKTGSAKAFHAFQE